MTEDLANTEQELHFPLAEDTVEMELELSDDIEMQVRRQAHLLQITVDEYIRKALTEALDRYEEEISDR